MFDFRGWEKALESGAVTSCDLFPTGSNYTFLVHLERESGPSAEGFKAVYKPRDGEAPLWDFPSGTLYKREYAAYLLSLLLGWDLVPPSVIREGPHGTGSFQLYIEHDPSCNYFALRKSHVQELKTMACFDLVANNADRKASHCLLDSDGHVWGIDHGLTFHAMTKVRTVIWDFIGQPVPSNLLKDLKALLSDLERPEGRAREFLSLLHPEEVAALRRRINLIVERGIYPRLNPYAIPWPII